MSQPMHSGPCALVIGLGAMGSAILERLHAQGWTVAGVDPNPVAVQRTRDQGHFASQELTGVPDGLVAGCCLLTSLPNDDVVSTVVEQIEGLPAQRRPALVVETSTILPSTIQAAQKRLRPVAPMIDMAVSGGPDQVASGTLISYVAGQAETREAVLARLLDDLSDRIVDCPRVGDAKLVKILNNTMGWAATVVGAEAVAAGVAHGMDPAWLVSALSTGNGRSHQFVKRFGRLMEGDHTPYFSLAMGQKDAHLGLAVARDLHAPARMTEALEASLSQVQDAELLSADIVEYYTHYQSHLPDHPSETTPRSTTS